MWPLYEFRHLTFQEYLAAHAIAEGHYPDRQESNTVLGVLQPYLDQQSWKQVIPLTAVLAGRNTRPLIEHLTERCEREYRYSVHAHQAGEWLPESINQPSLLAQCLLDEVPLPPVLAERAILALVRTDTKFSVPIEKLARGRHRDVLERVLKADLEHNIEDFIPLGSAIGSVGKCWWKETVARGEQRQAVEQLKQGLRSGSPIDQAFTALTLMKIVYNKEFQKIKSNEVIIGLEPLLQAPQPFLHGAAMWAYASLADTNYIRKPLAERIMPHFFDLWMHSTPQIIRSVAGWAIGLGPWRKLYCQLTGIVIYVGCEAKRSVGSHYPDEVRSHLSSA